MVGIVKAFSTAKIDPKMLLLLACLKLIILTICGILPHPRPRSAILDLVERLGKVQQSYNEILWDAYWGLYCQNYGRFLMYGLTNLDVKDIAFFEAPTNFDNFLITT